MERGCRVTTNQGPGTFVRVRSRTLDDQPRTVDVRLDKHVASKGYICTTFPAERVRGR